MGLVIWKTTNFLFIDQYGYLLQYIIWKWCYFEVYPILMMTEAWKNQRSKKYWVRKTLNCVNMAWIRTSFGTERTVYTWIRTFNFAYLLPLLTEQVSLSRCINVVVWLRWYYFKVMHKFCCVSCLGCHKSEGRFNTSRPHSYTLNVFMLAFFFVSSILEERGCIFSTLWA